MRWIITFSDLVTLMLVFFVMIFSVSSVDVGKFESVVSPLSQRDISLDQTRIAKPNSSFNMETKKDADSKDSLDYVFNLLEFKIAENPVLREIKVQKEGKVLKMSLPSDIVFQSNSVALHNERKQVFLSMLQQLVGLNNQMSFVAYSDPRPIVSGGYSSNEKLSLARAMAVAKLIKQMGYAGSPKILLGGTGYFNSLDKTIPLEERYILSRKVDIMIYDEALNEKELYLLPNV